MSNGFGISLNQAFLYEGVRIVFKGRARDTGRSYLFNDPQGLQVRFSNDEIAKLRETDGLRDWRPSLDPSVANGGQRRPAVMVETATQAEMAEIDRRLDYCLAWAERPGVPRSTRGLAPIIAAVHAHRAAQPQEPGQCELPPPSVSTMQKWLSKWLERGRVAAALVPQHRLKGSDKTKLTAGMSQMVAEYIDEYYLTRKRHPIAEFHRKLVEYVEKLNKGLSATAQVAEPCYETVRKAVNDLCQYTTDYCRRGRAYANEKWRAIGSGIVTERANEVWEIDDTRVDVICKLEDGTTVIGRPWLIVVIDRHTRMLMSFVLSFSPPDTTAALEAVKLAIRTKEDLLKEHGVSGKYAAHGLPETVHVDNGKQYNSLALKRGLAQIGINHRTMPVLKAWYKGIVERIIGTLTRQVFHVVPGTTHSNIFERDQDLVPELVAEATIGDLRRKLLDWMVNTYQHQHHKGIDDTPAAMWKKNVAIYEMRLPPSWEDIESALSLTVVRMARKTGIQFKNLVYVSEHLTRALHKPKSAKVSELIVRIDRQNLEVVQFLDPSTDTWFPAFLRKDLLPRVLGRTLEEYEIASALRRARGDEFVEGDPNYSETYAVLEATREKQAQDPKLGPRVKAAGERERLLKGAKRLTEPVSEVPPEPGEDLFSKVTQVGERLPAPPPATSGHSDANIASVDWAAKNNLGARVRQPKKAN